MRRRVGPGAIKAARVCLALGSLSLGVVGCSAIADVSDYRFGTCTPGTERCRCAESDACNEGLECRPPGVCVNPNSQPAAAGAGARQ